MLDGCATVPLWNHVGYENGCSRLRITPNPKTLHKTLKPQSPGCQGHWAQTNPKICILLILLLQVPSQKKK